MVPKVEPFLFPVNYFTRQLVRDVHFIHSLTELDTRTTNHDNFFQIWLQFKVKEMVEKLEMGLDAQKSFTQMYEDGNVKDRVGEKMMQLNPIVIKKTRE